MGASCLCLYLLCSMPLTHGTLFRIHFLYNINHGREKDDLSLSGASVRGGHGTEICEGGVRHELGGAYGTERDG